MRTSKDYNEYMNEALNLAKIAMSEDEVPIGAVVVYEGKIIGIGYNQKNQNNKITSHAEIIAIENASIYLNSWNLSKTELYTTLEPCLMCFGAIKQSRIDKVYVGAQGNRNKDYCYSKYIEKEFETGMMEKESQNLLKDFFTNKR